MISEWLVKVAGRRALKGMGDMTAQKIDPHFSEDLGRVGLYVHIPFCKRFCPYCPFWKVAYTPERAEGYVEALKGEIDLYRERLGSVEIGDVYFGGGTPSLIPEKLVEILDYLRSRFEIKGEIALEANPDDVNESMCDMLREVGMEKISIGVQSFDDQILKSIRRRHDGEAAYRAIGMAMEKGFFLSADLMFALPGQSLDVVMADVKKMVDLGVPEICCYPLIPYPKTKLCRDIKNGVVKLPPARLEKKMYYSVMGFLIDRGYDAGLWEFRKKGAGMEYATCTRSDEHIGLGASAYSMVSSLFYTNIARLEEYSKSIDQKKLPISSWVRLDNAHTIRGPMMELARRGSIKRTELGESNEKSMANMFRVMKLLTMIKERDDEIFMTRRGNYLLSVMAKEFMPGPGKRDMV